MLDSNQPVNPKCVKRSCRVEEPDSYMLLCEGDTHFTKGRQRLRDMARSSFVGRPTIGRSAGAPAKSSAC